MKIIKNILLGLFGVLFFFSACSYQGGKKLEKKRGNTAIFIALPRSSFIFEDLATPLYEALVKHFKRLGYRIVDNERTAHYVLKTVINEMAPLRKYVSPDVLLYGYTLKLDISCSLYKVDNVLIGEKRFACSTLISRARNPILNVSFFSSEITKMLTAFMPQIELYFRRYLL